MSTSTGDTPTEGTTPADLQAAAADFTWLLNRFATETAGVVDAIAVSSDGLLIAVSELREHADSERLAAIVSGITSLAHAAPPATTASAASTRSSSTWRAGMSWSPRSAAAPCSASSPTRRPSSATSRTR